MNKEVLKKMYSNAGFQKFQGQKDTAKKAISKAEMASIDAFNNYAALTGFANATLGDINTMRTKAKELGLDLDPAMLDMEKSLKSEINALKSNATTLQGASKTLSDVRISIK